MYEHPQILGEGSQLPKGDVFSFPVLLIERLQK